MKQTRVTLVLQRHLPVSCTATDSSQAEPTTIPTGRCAPASCWPALIFEENGLPLLVLVLPPPVLASVPTASSPARAQAARRLSAASDPCCCCSCAGCRSEPTASPVLCRCGRGLATMLLPACCSCCSVGGTSAGGAWRRRVGAAPKRSAGCRCPPAAACTGSLAWKASLEGPQPPDCWLLVQTARAPPAPKLQGATIEPRMPRWASQPARPLQWEE